MKKAVLFTMMLFIFVSVAWAQGDEYVLPAMLVTVLNMVAVPWIVNSLKAIFPTEPGQPNQERNRFFRWGIAWGLSILTAVFAIFIQGQWSSANLWNMIALAILASQASYNLIWHPVGAAKKRLG